MQYLFGLTLSEMGISPLLLAIIISFSILFIVAFGLSSKNMDSDGIMNWMMKKPEDWIGKKIIKYQANRVGMTPYSFHCTIE